MDDFLLPSASSCDWVEVGSTTQHLVETITKLYWEGVLREVGRAILCMKQWKDVQSLPEEDDIFLRLPAAAADFISLWGECCQVLFQRW